jgi:hypothetical protein
MPLHLLKCELAKDLITQLIDLKKKTEIILPGDPPTTHKEGVVLSFDDPFYAFYHDLFPLLKKHEIRVLLGVSPRYILERTSVSNEERLSVPKTLAFQDEFFEKKAPFCTWEELNEMIGSGFVEIASHTYSKMDLTQAICSFIYPLGKTNSHVHELVKGIHRFSFTLGKGHYKNWNGSLYSRKPLP